MGASRVSGSSGVVAALATEGDTGFQKIVFSGGAPVSGAGAASPLYAEGVLLHENRLYLGAEGLFIYNAQDPASPQLLSNKGDWSKLLPLAVSGNDLFGLMAAPGSWEKQILSVINVADPANPTAVKNYIASSVLVKGVISGSRAYLLLQGRRQARKSSTSHAERSGQGGGPPFPSYSQYDQHDIAALETWHASPGIPSTVSGPYLRRDQCLQPGPQSTLTPGGRYPTLAKGHPASGSSNVQMSDVPDNVIEAFDLTDPANPKPAGQIRTQKGAYDFKVLTQEGQDPIIALAKPGGSVHTVSYSPTSGTFTPGPICPSPYSHQVTVSQSPNRAGGYTVVTSDSSFGTYSQEIKRKQTTCCLTTEVSPAQAAAEGCTATPTRVDPVDCGGTVDVTAVAKEPWIFKEWTGAATGTSPSAQATAIANCSMATANFWKPTLTLGTGLLNPNYVAEFYGIEGEYDYANGRKNVVANHLTLTANEVDDWLVKGLTYQTSGEGDEKEDIAEARLYLNSVGGALLGTGTFNANNGNISFSFNHVIPKSSSSSMVLVYDYKPEAAWPCNDYRTYIDMSGVNAIPVNYPPGQKLPAPPNGAVQGAVSVRMGDIVKIDGDNQYGEAEDPAKNKPLEKPLKTRLKWQHPATVNFLEYRITSNPAFGAFLAHGKDERACYRKMQCSRGG
jgi:hypothetical protein